MHVLRGSTLEWLPSEPFLLKVEFQMYDLSGVPAEKGTAEESWTRAGGRVLRIESPSLQESTDADDDAKRYTRESFLVRQALLAITRPLPDPPKRQDFVIDAVQQVVEGTERSCFALLPGGSWSPSKAAFCTDMDNRLVAMTGPLFVITRADFRKHVAHEVPMELKLSYEGRTAVTLHVTELDSLPEEPAPANERRSASAPSNLSGAFMAGKSLKKKDPKYPKEAKKQRIAGSVMIAACISKEGTIAHLDVIASPSALLSESAIDAVKTWTYKPYLLNGQPTVVDTTITVNYALNR